MTGLGPGERDVGGRYLLQDDERIAFIRADRYVRVPRAERALKLLETLLHYPQRDRMPCLLIYGDTGMGKTEIIHRFERDHPPLFNATTGVTTMPVVMFQLPPEPIEGDFYAELLRAIGVPTPMLPPSCAARDLARRLLVEMGTRMLILDEVHAMLAGTHRQQRIFLNTIRFLTNDLRIPIVCAGTQDARMALLTDPQLADRFDALYLDRWFNDQALQRLLASFAVILPLRGVIALDSPSVRHRVIHMTNGNTGRIFRLLEAVAIAAIVSGRECIDESSFDAADVILPLVSMQTRPCTTQPRRTKAVAIA